MKHKKGIKLERFFLLVFLILSLLVSLTLFFYYKMNLTIEKEFSHLRDIHYIKANLVKFSESKVKGYVEIQEIFDGLNIIGKVDGLEPGSEHSVHILEFSDLADVKESRVTKEMLRHYNPTNVPHFCPNSYVKSDDYHFGDLGNIIANNEGTGFISLIKNIPIKSLNGRVLVVTKTKDKCESQQEFDDPSNILAYGLLNAYKQELPSNIEFSHDYFIKKINSNSNLKQDQTISTNNAKKSENISEIKKDNFKDKIGDHVLTNAPVPIVEQSIPKENHNETLLDKVIDKPHTEYSPEDIPSSRQQKINSVFKDSLGKTSHHNMKHKAKKHNPLEREKSNKISKKENAKVNTDKDEQENDDSNFKEQPEDEFKVEKKNKSKISKTENFINFLKNINHPPDNDDNVKIIPINEDNNGEEEESPTRELETFRFFAKPNHSKMQDIMNFPFSFKSELN